MKCPKCKSSRIHEEEKGGEIVCETCGYVFDEQERIDFKKDTHSKTI